MIYVWLGQGYVNKEPGKDPEKDTYSLFMCLFNLPYINHPIHNKYMNVICLWITYQEVYEGISSISFYLLMCMRWGRPVLYTNHTLLDLSTIACHLCWRVGARVSSVQIHCVRLRPWRNCCLLPDPCVLGKMCVWLECVDAFGDW